MMPPQTLAEFYAAKLRQPLPDSLRSGGHFAVFRLEDFAADAALAAAYGRRDFYKIMLGTGHATYHYGARRQLLEPGQQALVFTNAQVPYGWEVHGLPYRGYCCGFTEAFVLAYSRLPLGELAVFQPEAVPFFRFAIDSFMEGLPHELKQFNSRVSTSVPGTVRSDFEASIQCVPTPADDPYALRVREQTLASYDKAAKP